MGDCGLERRGKKGEKGEREGMGEGCEKEMGLFGGVS